MKSKIVLWGSNAQDEKILIAVALRAEENMVDIWTFPESVANEDFYHKMMKEWRNGDQIELPEPQTHLERELTISESLLPDELKPERSDVVQRAQTEWHFIVLSSKLHEAYESELSELRERVEKLEEFDEGVWDNLKDFWGKLQEQVRERNLFRSHADSLRDNTNALFGKMKELRSKLDEQFEGASKEAYDTFVNALDEIEAKVNEGTARLAPLFDELKKIQRKFRQTEFTREHRNQLWEKLNNTFKEVKQKRFGGKIDDGNSQFQRLQRRYNGLVSAIEKMEQSIRRDKNDLDFQKHKVATTDGQLEAQIRQAKIVMIDERVRSKEDKLNEMKATQADLDKRLQVLKEKESKRAARESAKEKIAEEIKAAAEARGEDAEKLEKAAGEISAGKPTGVRGKKGESFAETAGTMLSESFEDVMDTVKAVASVISEKIEELKEDLTKEETPAEQEAAPPAVSETSPPAQASEEMREIVPVEPEGTNLPAEVNNGKNLVEEAMAAEPSQEEAVPPVEAAIEEEDLVEETVSAEAPSGKADEEK